MYIFNFKYTYTHTHTHTHTQVADSAISALINLCADELPSVVEELLRRGIVDRLVEVCVCVCVCVCV